MRVKRRAGLIALSIMPLFAYGGGCSNGSPSSSTPDGGSSSSGGGTASGSSSSSSGGGSSSGGTAEACAAPCQMACATELCAATPAEPTSGDACDVCFGKANNAGGPCYPAVAAACGADPDCVALLGSQGCMAGCQSLGDGGSPSGDAGSDATEDAGVGDAGGDGSMDQACLGSASAALCKKCCDQVHKQGAMTALTAALMCSCCQ